MRLLRPVRSLALPLVAVAACGGSGRAFLPGASGADASTASLPDATADAPAPAPDTAPFDAAPDALVPLDAMSPADVARADAIAPADVARTETGVPVDARPVDASHSGCVRDAECATPTPYCDTATAHCVACVDSTQCATGRSCSQHACVPFACEPGHDVCASATTVARCSDDGLTLGTARSCDTGRPNTTVTCSNGACATHCDARWGDCNGIASDGCEHLVDHDVSNCGACSNVCAVPAGSFATCTSGACGSQCNTGRDDCTSAPGCETDVSASDANCGSCGNACASGTRCRAGTCTANTCAGLLALDPSAASGLYAVSPLGDGNTVQVRCEMSFQGGGWTMVHKLNRGTGAYPHAEWYGSALNETDASAMDTAYSGTTDYLSRIVPAWNNGVTVREALLGVYTSGTVRAWFRFDASGTDRTSWFTGSRITASSYGDIVGGRVDVAQINGAVSGGYDRNWALISYYGGCSDDRIWLTVRGNTYTTGGCGYELSTPRPLITYSTNGAAGPLTNNFARADTMVVWVR